MADGHIAQHLVKKKSQAVPARHPRKISGKFLFGSSDIESVVIRIIEKRTLYSPRIVVHLVPLASRVDINLHVADVELLRFVHAGATRR